MDNLVFSLPEAIHDDNFVFAFYYLKLPRQIDVYKKALDRQLERGFLSQELQIILEKNTWEEL